MIDRTLTVVLITMLAMSLPGCRSNEERGAVESAGATAGRVIDDSVITARVKTALIADSTTKAHQINVTTYEGTVQLSGFVDSDEARRRAAEIARGAPGVRDVRNSLELRK